MSPLNSWGWPIGRLWGELEQLVKWPSYHLSGIISFVKKRKNNLHHGAGIGSNCWGLCTNLFWSLLRIKETNLKPREMNINIIPHYCIQIPKILIGGDLEPGWVFDERLVTTVFESTAVWTSACSAVGLSGSGTPGVSTTNLCVCRGEIVRGFLRSSDIFSSSRIFTTTGKIYSWCRWLVQLVVDGLTGPQIYIYGGKITV